MLSTEVNHLDTAPPPCDNCDAGLRAVICVKNPRVDEWVSGGILASGVWEKEIVVEVMRTMDQYPEAVFMDIGSNIGQYHFGHTMANDWSMGDGSQ